MSQITIHVLDIALGCPASGISVSLHKQADSFWQLIGEGRTSSEGKIPDLLAADLVLNLGCYRLRFNTQAYFSLKHEKSLYPYIDVVFNVYDNDQHYHIPVLISAYGYTTYRGS